MARINTNVSSLTAQRGLAKSQKNLSDTLQRLSSGLRINRGADDPAGLIASESLRSEISGISQGIDNASRASNVIATTEGALQEVASLLLNIKDLEATSWSAPGSRFPAPEHQGPRRRGRQQRRPLPRRDRRKPAPGRFRRRIHHPHFQH